jgi:hypothetical protein
MVSSLETYFFSLLQTRHAAEIVLVRDDAKNVSSCCSKSSRLLNHGPLECRNVRGLLTTRKKLEESTSKKQGVSVAPPHFPTKQASKSDLFTVDEEHPEADNASRDVFEFVGQVIEDDDDDNHDNHASTTSKSSAPPRVHIRQVSKSDLFTLDEDSPLPDDVLAIGQNLFELVDKVIADEENMSVDGTVTPPCPAMPPRWSSKAVNIR